MLSFRRVKCGFSLAPSKKKEAARSSSLNFSNTQTEELAPKSPGGNEKEMLKTEPPLHNVATGVVTADEWFQDHFRNPTRHLGPKVLKRPLSPEMQRNFDRFWASGGYQENRAQPIHDKERLSRIMRFLISRIEQTLPTGRGVEFTTMEDLLPTEAKKLLPAGCSPSVFVKSCVNEFSCHGHNVNPNRSFEMYHYLVRRLSVSPGITGCCIPMGHATDVSKGEVIIRGAFRLLMDEGMRPINPEDPGVKAFMEQCPPGMLRQKKMQRRYAYLRKRHDVVARAYEHATSASATFIKKGLGSYRHIQHVKLPSFYPYAIDTVVQRGITEPEQVKAASRDLMAALELEMERDVSAAELAVDTDQWWGMVYRSPTKFQIELAQSWQV